MRTNFQSSCWFGFSPLSILGYIVEQSFLNSTQCHLLIYNISMWDDNSLGWWSEKKSDQRYFFFLADTTTDLCKFDLGLIRHLQTSRPNPLEEKAKEGQSVDKYNIINGLTPYGSFCNDYDINTILRKTTTQKKTTGVGSKMGCIVEFRIIVNVKHHFSYQYTMNFWVKWQDMIGNNRIQECRFCVKGDADETMWNLD